MHRVSKKTQKKERKQKRRRREKRRRARNKQLTESGEKYGDGKQRQTLFGSLTFIMSVSLVLVVKTQ